MRRICNSTYDSSQVLALLCFFPLSKADDDLGIGLATTY